MISFTIPSWALAQEKDSEAPVGAVGGAVHADLFTGTATTSIPIEVPPGRQGVQPELALVYGSANGNGWVGMGWKLEKSVIERRTKDGLDYSAEDYVVRLSGINAELVSINPTNTDFRAKIEGSFTRILKLPSQDDSRPYFEATDKLGKKYRFGYTVDSRLYDPADPDRIFRWCLDRVEDIHGNYMTITYTTDENQGYLAQIDYTGNVGQGLPTTNRVIFHLEDDRTDVNPMYDRAYLDPDTNNNALDSPPYKTAKRLKTIEVLANTHTTPNGVLQRAYKLDYDDSVHTGHSQLASVQQFGSDTAIDQNDGTIDLLVGTTGTGQPPTSLPAMIFTTSPESKGNFPTLISTNHDSGPNNAWKAQMADVNGDGLVDSCAVLLLTGPPHRWATSCALSNGDGTFADPLPVTEHGSGVNDKWQSKMADVNGDGKADSCATLLLTGTPPSIPHRWVTSCALSNGDGTFASPDSTEHGLAVNEAWQTIMVDVNRDGMTDSCATLLLTGPPHSWTTSCALSNGDGTFADPVPTEHSLSINDAWKSRMGDVNGDGLTDSCAILLLTAPHRWATACALGNGDGTFADYVQTEHGSGANTAWRPWMLDVNGDGLTDSCVTYQSPTNGWTSKCALSEGDGSFADPVSTPYDSRVNSAWQLRVADVNGDGLTDFCAVLLITTPNRWRTECALSQGDGKFAKFSENPTYYGFNQASVPWMVDVNGDGMTDSCVTLLLHSPNRWSTSCTFNDGVKPFLLTNIDNGLGGSTTVDYVPSTYFRADHTQLPFSIQVVGAITTDDGNLNVSTTTYTYAGGYFHLAEREFRGFNIVTSIGPKGPNDEQTVNTTWFHQGNDTAVDANTPGDLIGYLKGAPYRTQVHALVDDGQGNITPELYLDTTIEYTPDDDGAAPFFTPKLQETATICDGDYPNCTVTASNYSYDPFGNVFSEVSFGDLSDPSDDRTVIKTYQYNTDDWLVSFPSSTTLYEGIGTGGTQVSHADFYYDGTTSCAVASTNQVPTEGLLTRSVNWLDGGTDPETRLAYDALGNPVCSRDANGNESTTTYDSQKTFEISSTNALSHVTTTQYYGVDTVPQDNGLYGQIKQVTDPNTATVSSTYDKLGRVNTVTQPDGFTVTKSYVDLGTVGLQHVQTVNDLGLWSQVYFDGLGRKIVTASLGTTASNGIDVKTIITETEYNVRGAVHRTRIPYFLGDPVPDDWTTQFYDAMGRVVRTEYPDNTVTQKCYNQWESWSIDANDHATYQLRNSMGKPVTVVEYQEYIPTQGETINCDTPFVPYSTTTYTYDVQGRVLTTTDALLNTITLQYNTLGRKTSMNDPDMGLWTYAHDAVGNIIQQLDAKGQYIYFQYDALNRLVQKDYGTQKALGSGDVVYTYDVGTHGKGRLTHVSDSSGSTTFHYDIKGQLIQSDKAITGSGTYVTQTTYDGMGRIKTSTYPDTSVLTYNYDGPALKEVKEGSTVHVGYRDYNARGQAKFVDFGNGVTTTYTYNPLNARINTLQTVSSIAPTDPLLALSYIYDAVGNITSIDDIDSNPLPVLRDQTFEYDAQNRLTNTSGPYGSVTYAYNQIGNITNNTRVGTTYTYDPAHPHAVKTAGGNTYNYDANGNMTDGAGRVLTYDFENRPTQITKTGVTTDLVYDGDGGRVMKTVGGVSTIYVGKTFVCEAGICSRMIFAGGQRIAEIETLSGARRYYHTDHLGSTGVVTDDLGNNIQDLTYYPFGQAYNNTGTVDVRYKFTSKELDNSTELYFYEARYYDAWLGRFISADTIVPGPFDPQALNRYSYVRNNPVNMTDPSGHFFVALVAHFLGAPDWVAGILDPFGTLSGVLNDWDIGAMALEQGIAAASAFTGGATVKALGGKYLSYLAGAVVSAATRSALYDLAGHDVNYGQSILTGLAISAVTSGIGDPTKFDFTRLATGYIASGIAAELNGGDFSRSLLTGFNVSAAGFLGNAIAQRMTNSNQNNEKNHATPQETMEVALGGNGSESHRFISTEDAGSAGQYMYKTSPTPDTEGFVEVTTGSKNFELSTDQGLVISDAVDSSLFDLKFGLKSGNTNGQSTNDIATSFNTGIKYYKGGGQKHYITPGIGRLQRALKYLDR